MKVLQEKKYCQDQLKDSKNTEFHMWLVGWPILQVNWWGKQLSIYHVFNLELQRNLNKYHRFLQGFASLYRFKWLCFAVCLFSVKLCYRQLIFHTSPPENCTIPPKSSPLPSRREIMTVPWMPQVEQTATRVIEQEYVLNPQFVQRTDSALPSATTSLANWESKDPA